MRGFGLSVLRVFISQSVGGKAHCAYPGLPQEQFQPPPQMPM